MVTILIVEDDKNTQLLTAARLKPFYTIVCANNGEEALDIIYNQRIDLIIADIMMPKMNGLELLKTLREEKFDMPVLLFTAKQTIEDKRKGFSLGTDDYLIKPVEYDELLWRVKALLRRSQINTEKKIVIGSTSIDESTFRVTSGDEVIELPKKEFEILFKLLSYPNKIFTHSQLLDDIWGYDSWTGEDTIKVHINRLRKKLTNIHDFEILTVRGLGYKAEIKEDNT